MAYCSQMSVLKEAALWFQEIGATPAGTANGSNKVFTVDHKPLVDRTGDDSVDAADVALYVDGTSVTVSAVNETTGAITVPTAPGNGTDVTVDYAYSSVSSDEVVEVIQEASEWVDDELGQLLSDAQRAASKRVRMLTRMYAAGLLMQRFYALENNEEQANTGAAKLKLAKREMTDYRTRLEENGSDAGDQSIIVSSSRLRLFQRYDESEGRWDKLSDENFTVNRES